MPSTSRPEAVSSMFSVTETSCTPALTERRPDGHVVLHGAGQAIDLVDDDRADPALGYAPEHGLQHGSVGGARGLAGVGELSGEPHPFRRYGEGTLPAGPGSSSPRWSRPWMPAPWWRPAGRSPCPWLVLLLPLLK